MSRPTRNTRVRAKFSFEVPIYACHVWVVVCDTFKGAIKALPPRIRNGIDIEDDGDCRGCCLSNHPNYVITLKDVSQGTLYHEIGHAARDIMDAIGFEITRGSDGHMNDEPLAYLEGALAELVAVGLARNKIKIKTKSR